MKIGYIRVSTEEQNHDRQIDSLGAICEKLHIEYISAVSRKHPKFEKLLRSLKSGDTMVVNDHAEGCVIRDEAEKARVMLSRPS